MSTRANIIIESKKDKEKLYFYRHSDGYPEGTLPTLNIFMDWLKKGIIRDNVQQSAGWLILIGAIEYNTIPEFDLEKPGWRGAKVDGDINTIKNPTDWKCGAYEPTNGIHGDIVYLYEINLDDKTLVCKEAEVDYSKDWTDSTRQTFKVKPIDAYLEQVLNNK